MQSDDPRKLYWNDKYLEYWRARVAESGEGASSIVKGDVKTEDDVVYEKIFKISPFIDGNILDVGCAWGRMFPIYLTNGLTIYGVDISEAMIEAAKLEWEKCDEVKLLKECTAEKLPFKDAEFDNLVCLATFDATYQDQALNEFIRVTKPGAHIYITGKNDNYYANDSAAIAAEIGARKKGHPNYFTNTKNLIEQMESNGHHLIASYYFPRRGDFANMRYYTAPPDKFYEYFLVFQRGKNINKLLSISSMYSKTYHEIEKNSEY